MKLVDPNSADAGGVQTVAVDGRMDVVLCLRAGSRSACGSERAGTRTGVGGAFCGDAGVHREGHGAG